MSGPTAQTTQWWLLQDGSPAGPFSHSDLVNGLREGRLTLDALVTPVGSTKWRPLREWQDFAANQTHSDSPSNDPWSTMDLSKGRNRPRATLPDMAQWICSYGLYVSPVLWLINQASCIAGAPLFADSSPLVAIELVFNGLNVAVTFAVVVLLFLGGLYLRQAMRLGARLLAVGLAIDLGWFVVGLALMALLMMAAAQDVGVQHLSPDEPGSAGFAAVMCIGGLAAGVFEVVALVWLLTKGRDLPLQ